MKRKCPLIGLQCRSQSIKEGVRAGAQPRTKAKPRRTLLPLSLSLFMGSLLSYKPGPRAYGEHHTVGCASHITDSQDHSPDLPTGQSIWVSVETPWLQVTLGCFSWTDNLSRTAMVWQAPVQAFWLLCKLMLSRAASLRFMHALILFAHSKF